jgi:FkbM family methyltransferase
MQPMSQLDALRRFTRDAQPMVAQMYRLARRPSSIELAGVKLELGPWATSEIRTSFYNGRYEMSEREIVERTLRADDVVLESGCGIGYVTTVVAGIAREIRSFDANPQVVDIARETVARNGRQAKLEAAVLARGPSSPTVPFYVASDFWASSLEPFDGGRRIDVPVHDFVEACRGCSYLLVDIEGGEVDLLRGEIPDIQRICVETHPLVTSPAQITEMLRSLFEQGFMIDVSLTRHDVLYLARD